MTRSCAQLPRYLALVFVAILIARGASAQIAPADTNWRALYLQDLAAARDIIEGNHPGVIDPKHPEFRVTLRDAYQEALQDSIAISSYAAYHIAMRRFGNRFQDGHLNVGGTRRAMALRAAGLFPVWRKGTFVIEAVDPRYGADTTLLRGAAIVACDGRSSNASFTSRVLSWMGRETIEADWYRYAPYFFLDYGPPLAGAPSTCRVRTSAGERDIALRWQPVSPETNRLFQRASSGVPRRLAVDEIQSGSVLWVTVGTFATNSDSLVTAMRSMIDSLRGQLTRQPNRSLIVVDLRGNDGGNSAWGDQVARLLFGDDWWKQASAWLWDGVYAEWRVSRDNVATIEQELRQAEKQYGVDSDQAKYQRRIHDGLSQSLAHGDAYWSQASRPAGVPRPSASRSGAPVVVVTDALCFSACLDFMDLMRLHPAVTHVGTTTAVDTEFMENWGQALPSGLGRIGYPMKVYRNRRRAHNEAYAPKVAFDGAINDTVALRAWVLSTFSR